MGFPKRVLNSGSGLRLVISIPLSVFRLGLNADGPPIVGPAVAPSGR